VARIVAVTPDLMLGSKVEAMLGAAGHEVTIAPAPAGVEPGTELVVADLDSCDPAALAAAEPPVLGYYSHVNAETREAALAAGIELVVPRSRLVRELPQLAAGLLP